MIIPQAFVVSFKGRRKQQRLRHKYATALFLYYMKMREYSGVRQKNCGAILGADVAGHPLFTMLICCDTVCNIRLLSVVPAAVLQNSLCPAASMLHPHILPCVFLTNMPALLCPKASPG